MSKRKGIVYHSRTAAQKEVWDAEIARGAYDLSLAEKWWRDQYVFLKSKGYILRPRYNPEWIPSWKDTDLVPIFCEDSVRLLKENAIDATRVSDGKTVFFKRVRKDASEARIALHFSTEELRTKLANHCVPIYDFITDTPDSRYDILVMPLLKPYHDHPYLVTIGDAVEFIYQVLEGLSFMHSQLVAHRDLSWGNIFMNADQLYPRGFHAIRQIKEPDLIRRAKAVKGRRHVKGLKYYIIDFEMSSKFEQGQSSLVTGRDGLDRTVPEFAGKAPYDAFAVDIYTVGNLLRDNLLLTFSNVEFLRPLVLKMTSRDPKSRPNANEAFRTFQEIRERLGFWHLHMTLHHNEKNAVFWFADDFRCLISDGAHSVMSNIIASTASTSKACKGFLQSHHR